MPLDRSHYGWVLMMLAAAWPPAAWALEQSKSFDIAGWNWVQILLCGATCLWGSMARTNQREKLAAEKWTRLENALELWRDARRSSVIGAVIYFTASAQGWNDWQLGGALLMAGYSGPAALDLWAEKFRGKE